MLPRGTLIVPERWVLGQAVASQVPDATLVMFRLTALAGIAVIVANSSIIRVRRAATLYIRDLVLIFVFIVLLGLIGLGRNSSPAKRIREG
jgi:hypothetical protein